MIISGKSSKCVTRSSSSFSSCGGTYSGMGYYRIAAVVMVVPVFIVIVVRTVTVALERCFA